MKDFIQVDVVDANEIDKYLKKGWELIETTKTVFEDGESRLNYHVGFTANSKVVELKRIIRLYEEHGLKDELLKRVAEGHGHNIDDYDQSHGHPVRNETVLFLERYEAAVNDKQTKFYQKLTSEELAERYNL